MDKLIKQIESLPVGYSIMTYERNAGSNAAGFYTNDLKRFKDRYLAMEEALKRYADEGNWRDSIGGDIEDRFAHKRGYEIARQALKETI